MQCLRLCGEATWTTVSNQVRPSKWTPDDMDCIHQPLFLGFDRYQPVVSPLIEPNGPRNPPSAAKLLARNPGRRRERSSASEIRERFPFGISVKGLNRGNFPYYSIADHIMNTYPDVGDVYLADYRPGMDTRTSGFLRFETLDQYYEMLRDKGKLVLPLPEETPGRTTR